MNYSILVRDDKKLLITSRGKINQKDDRIDYIKFLVPINYYDIDTSEAFVFLKYQLSGSENIVTEELESDYEARNGYYEYIFNVKDELTQNPGELVFSIEIWSEEKHINTEECSVPINKVSEIAYTDADMSNAYTSIEKLEDYLYEANYDVLDYDFANRYMDKHYPPIGGCSSVRKGLLFGRNYDWYYDNMPEFVVHVTETDTRHASVAVCSGIGELNNDFVNSGEYSSDYKAVPFAVLDGVNDAGVYGNINVVPTGDWGITTGTMPKIRLKKCLTAMTLLRFVLDNFDSATTAVEYLRDFTSIRMLYNDTIALEAHYMIADATKTYAVEFVNNEIVILDITNKPYMTNFYLKDMNMLPNSHVIDRTTITPHSMGVERYELIDNTYRTIEDTNDMIFLMHKDLKYTQMYSRELDPYWYTELTGNYETFGDITVTSPVEAFEPVIDYVIEQFEHRDRNTKETWQTVHTSVYNLEARKLYVIPQETGTQHIINL